ncbi:MAG TPA: hypothetical protein QGG37_07920 [Chloroflexota bacterium]|nr:hypothetical protein [Chloroflexota bacterium]
MDSSTTCFISVRLVSEQEPDYTEAYLEEEYCEKLETLSDRKSDDGDPADGSGE